MYKHSVNRKKSTAEADSLVFYDRSKQHTSYTAL